MFGYTRWNSFDDVFNSQRHVDRLFNQLWSDLPTRAAGANLRGYSQRSAPLGSTAAARRAGR